MSKNPLLDAAIAEAAGHTCDVTVRDGNQSKVGNLIRHPFILKMIVAANYMGKEYRNLTGKKLTAEVWGGGQVLQPGLHLGEDTIVNLGEICDAMPDLIPKCLGRGIYGFALRKRQSPIQITTMLDIAIERGMKDFRIFDMMNYAPYRDIAIEHLKKRRSERPELGITIEGAVCYTSEKGKEKRAYSLEYYAQEAVKLAQQGCNTIAIKNFSGTGDYEAVDLVRIMRKALDTVDNGKYKNVPLNFHSHGQKPEVLAACIAAGAHTVDVAVGELSKGPSHTDLRDLMYLLLAGKNGGQNFERAEIDAHPFMQALAEYERVVEEIMKTQSHKGISFRERAGLLDALAADHELMEMSGLAAGALSDLSGRIQDNYQAKLSEWQGLIANAAAGRKPLKGLLPKIHTPHEILLLALQLNMDIWERAGRYGRVTPGALLTVDFINPEVFAMIIGQKRGLERYNAALREVITGRMGTNRGFEQGIGDFQLRDTLLMLGALEVLNVELEAKRISSSTVMLILGGAQIGTKGNRLRVNSKIDLADSALEEKLSASKIENFLRAVEVAQISSELKAKLKYELIPQAAPIPTEGLDVGVQMVRDVVDDLNKRLGLPIIDVKKLIKDNENRPTDEVAIMVVQARLHNKRVGIIDLEAYHKAGLLSHPEKELPSLAIIYNNPGAHDPNETLRNMVWGKAVQYMKSQNAEIPELPPHPATPKTFGNALDIERVTGATYRGHRL